MKSGNCYFGITYEDDKFTFINHTFPFLSIPFQVSYFPEKLISFHSNPFGSWFCNSPQFTDDSVSEAIESLQALIQLRPEGFTEKKNNSRCFY